MPITTLSVLLTGMPITPSEPESTLARTFDPLEMEALFPDDPLAIQELVQSLVTTLPELVSTLREAITAGDAVAMARAAHTIGGSACYVGAGPVCRLTRVLERLARAGRTADMASEAHRLVASCDRLVGELGAWAATHDIA